jgi:hypothetical protein
MVVASGFSNNPHAIVFSCDCSRKNSVFSAHDWCFVRSIIKSAVSELGLDPRRFSGHPCVLRCYGFVASRIPYWVLRRWADGTSDAALKYYRSEEDVVASVRQALGVSRSTVR